MPSVMRLFDAQVITLDGVFNVGAVPRGVPYRMR